MSIQKFKIKDNAIFLRFKEETLDETVGSYCALDDKFRIIGHSSSEAAIKEGEAAGGEFEVWKYYRGRMRIIYNSAGVNLSGKAKVIHKTSSDIKIIEWV